MKQTNIAVGLDIGTTKIIAMVGIENKNGELEILGLGKTKSSGLSARGIVTNILNTTNTIKEAIIQAENKSNIEITEVITGIAGEHIRSMQNSDYIIRKNPEETITKKDINTLTEQQVNKLPMLPGQEIIEVIPQNFKINNYESNEPIGMCGERLDANFHIVIGETASIKNINTCVKNAGLNFSDITLEPLASADAVLSQEEKEAGVALIDIGGGTTDLAIFKNGIIKHTAIVPFGGNAITRDIHEGCSIMGNQAEVLKIKYGSAWPAENSPNSLIAVPGIRGRKATEVSLRQVSEIIYARIKEIFDQINIHIINWHNDPKKQLIAGIVLTGGGAELKHLRQLVEHLTGINTRIGYPNEHVVKNSSKEDLKAPSYATAVGLTIRGLYNLKHKNIEDKVDTSNKKEKTHTKKPSFMDRWVDKFKNMLVTVDNK